MLKAALQTLASLFQGPTTTPSPSGWGQVTVAPPGWAVSHQDGPRAVQLHHAFHDVPSFAAWLNRHADPQQTDILVGVGHAVHAWTERGKPNGHNVQLLLQHHPAAAPWLGVFGKPITQKRFAELLRATPAEYSGQMEDGRRWREVLLEAVMHLTRFKSDTMEARLGPHGQHLVKGHTSKAEMSVQLPTEFQLVLPYYLGVGLLEQVDALLPVEARYVIDVLIGLDLDGKAPTFTLSAPGLPLVAHQARTDAANHLVRLLDDGFLVGLGQLRGHEVKDLPSRFVPPPAST